MNEITLDSLKKEWKSWVKKENSFNFSNAISHLQAGRRLLGTLFSKVEAWEPVFPPQLLPQEKYQKPKSASYWRVKTRDNLTLADQALLKGIRHLETLWGYYETEKTSEDASYLQNFAERQNASLEEVIRSWGKEDFTDSVESADSIVSNRVFRNLKSIMADLRDAERKLS